MARKKPSASEMIILSVISKLGEATVNQIFDETNKRYHHKDWSFSSVSTFIKRLYAKGIINREKIEGTKEFTYTIYDDDYSTDEDLMLSHVDNLFQRHMRSDLNRIIKEKNDLPDHEYDILKSMVMMKIKQKM